jgi:LSD1 subclass zinc finger protein
MPTIVQCSGCGTQLKAPENSAGKKIRCPKCKAVIDVPVDAAPSGFVPAPTGPAQRPASPSSYPAPSSSGPVSAPTFAAPSAPASAPAPAPAPIASPAPAVEQWRVRMTLEGSLQTFGPVSREELQQWFQESRLDAETELERNFSGQWIGAAQVYPSLAPAPSAPRPQPEAPKPAAPTPVYAAPGSPTPVSPASIPAVQAPRPQVAGGIGSGFPQVGPPAAAGTVAGLPNIQTGASRPVTPPGSFPGVGPATKSASGSSGSGAFKIGIDSNSVSGISGRKKATPMAMGPGGRPMGMGGGTSSRSKMVAGLLGLFLGAWGVHRFYMGYTQMGIIQIVVTVLTCGIGGLWGVVEGIMILVGSMDKDADGLPLAP